MRIAKLFLVGTLLALLIAPSLAMASDVGARFDKVVKEYDRAVRTFKSAEYKRSFESTNAADRVRVKLELANRLLKEAQHDLSEFRSHHANARVLAADSLIKDAYRLSR